METKGVRILQGDSKKAIRKLAALMVLGMPVIFFTNVAAGILLGEGDMKRTMYVMILGSVLNIILDPIFIYVLNLKIVGAAWATIFSIFVSALFMFKWLFISKSTYVTFNFKHFKFVLEILKDILKLGFSINFFSIIYGFIIELLVAIILFLFADPIAFLFIIRRLKNHQLILKSLCIF